MLLVGLAGPEGDRLERAFACSKAAVERAHTIQALRSRIARVELDPPLVVYVDLTLLEAQGDALFFEFRRGIPAASWVALAPSLEPERAAHALGLGIPAVSLPRDFDVLVELAHKLASFAPASIPSRRPKVSSDPTGVGELAGRLETYAVARGLSEKQRAILRLYLSGSNDKAIAALCGCSVATVYEHWRRMAKKAGAVQKGDVITDFHRFLADG